MKLHYCDRVRRLPEELVEVDNQPATMKAVRPARQILRVKAPRLRPLANFGSVTGFRQVIDTGTSDSVTDFAANVPKPLNSCGVPKGIRTPVIAVKGRCPRPG